jgi:antitoxin component of MazEF toxin-antitoxin module
VRLHRVRRVGNSNVISLPRELEAVGFVVGSRVMIQQLPDGEVRLLPEDRVGRILRQYGRRSVRDNRAALEMLGESDSKL